MFLHAHAQERLLYRLKIALKTSLRIRWSQTKMEGEKSTMADSNATLSRSVSPSLRTVSESASAEEGRTDTNAYWKTL